MNWVTKATSGCFVFPKQWERHKCHFYLCSYQHRAGGHRLPFLVPATTASLRNLGPLRTIVLSYRKCGSLLTPSIHWVSCVRLPRPVFIFFAFCLYPPYRIFVTSNQTAQKRGWHYLLYWVEASSRDECIFISSGIYFSHHEGFCLVLLWPVFWQSFKFPSLYQVRGKEFFLHLNQKEPQSISN